MLCCPEGRNEIYETPIGTKRTTLRPPITPKPTRPPVFRPPVTRPSITVRPTRPEVDENPSHSNMEFKDLKMPHKLPKGKVESNLVLNLSKLQKNLIKKLLLTDCGNSSKLDLKIVGGHPAQPGGWPWMVVLIIK